MLQIFRDLLRIALNWYRVIVVPEKCQNNGPAKFGRTCRKFFIAATGHVGPDDALTTTEVPNPN